MSPITVDVVRTLARFRGEDAPVVSCYLDIDGRRYRRRQDYLNELDVLLRAVDERAGSATEAVGADLERIRVFVSDGVDRSTTRGLAMFACGAHGLWEAVPLPVPVRNQVVVNSAPAVGQLERLLQESERIGVLLADRQRAKVFVFELGELVDHSELLDELPRDYDSRGERERGDTANHVEELVQQHLRHAATTTFRVFQDVGFEHLVIGAPDEIHREVEQALHPYLRERLHGRLAVGVASSLDDLRSAVLDEEAAIERRQEQEAVERLRSAVAADAPATAGLAGVVDALAMRRVDHLLVSEGFARAGWRCAECERLAAVGRACPGCESEMAPLDDVVEEAVEVALTQGCRVTVCTGNADLDVLGRIGALLRF